VALLGERQGVPLIHTWDAAALRQAIEANHVDFIIDAALGKSDQANHPVDRARFARNISTLGDQLRPVSGRDNAVTRETDFLLLQVVRP
jgi:hypothetical protein